MKVKMKKVMMGFSLLLMLTLGVFTTASAKFWGWQITGTTDWADGRCVYRESCRVHYIFWIAGDEQCETVTIGCLD